MRQQMIVGIADIPGQQSPAGKQCNKTGCERNQWFLRYSQRYNKCNNSNNPPGQIQAGGNTKKGGKQDGY